MGDLEIVLLQTSLAEAPDAEALEQIQRLIHKRDLVTKMDVFGERAHRDHRVHEVQRFTGFKGSGDEHRQMRSDDTARDAGGSRARVGGRRDATPARRGGTRAPESKRLGRAKDYIADEQWPRAIEELRAGGGRCQGAETRRGALLARAQPEPVRRPGVGGRDDRPARARFPVEHVGQAGAIAADRDRRAAASQRRAVVDRASAAGAAGSHRGQAAAPPGRAPKVLPPPPLPTWYPDKYDPDADLRVQALGALMKTDAERVVPILGQIAFESEHPGPAARAVFMLAQSSLPQARATVVQVARDRRRRGRRVAAVRDLGRFGGPEASKDLLSLYTTANEPREVPDREVARRARRNARARRASSSPRRMGRCASARLPASDRRAASSSSPGCTSRPARRASGRSSSASSARAPTAS